MGNMTVKGKFFIAVIACIVVNGIFLPILWYEKSPKLRVDSPHLRDEISVPAELHEFDEKLVSPKEHSRDHPFKHYDSNRPPYFQLNKDFTQYFKRFGNLACLIQGTNWTVMDINNTSCQCNEDWFGPHCSWPVLLKFSEFDDYENLQLRDTPRRLVNGMSFNIELDILEMRLQEMAAADAFLIAESNFTGHGDPKPMYLLNALRSGRFSQHQHKIIHVFQDHFPPAARKNGWLADYLQRDILGIKGIEQQLKGVNDDDIFLLTDADEIISNDVLLFLKLHDGFAEPVCMNLHKTNYGFFWRVGTGDWVMCGAATFGFMRRLMPRNTSWLRNPMEHITANVSQQLEAYVKEGALVGKWDLCPPGVYCGWHCSWCFHLEGIQKKLISAINADFPRWGDYPEKTDLAYIRTLVRDGKWFDEKETFFPLSPQFYMYAPNYVISNPGRFQYLLTNPYKNMSSLFNATLSFL